MVSLPFIVTELLTAGVATSPVEDEAALGVPDCFGPHPVEKVNIKEAARHSTGIHLD